MGFSDNFRNSLMALAGEDPLKYQALRKLRVIEYLDLLELKVKHNRLTAQQPEWGEG
ncbi:MAG TPA: hypothetical protein VG603_05645 [Chitinophagales bacterium]|nr:hypothetical protein [Chitinophagales bacterium]